MGNKIRLCLNHLTRLNAKTNEKKRVVPTTVGKACRDVSSHSGKWRFIPKKPANKEAPPSTSATTLMRSSICMILAVVDNKRQ